MAETPISPPTLENAMWGSGDVGFFDRIAGWYDRLHPSPDGATYEAAFAGADRPVETVLDLAGWTGRVARVLERRDPDGDHRRRTVVVDVARGMLRRAARHTDAVQGDAGRLPIRSGGVDAVICVDAFHHLPNPAGSLEECARVLAPGGVFVLVDFDPETIPGRLVAMAEHAVGMGSTFHRRERAVDALGSAGFDVRTAETGWATYRIVARKSEAIE